MCHAVQLAWLQPAPSTSTYIWRQMVLIQPPLAFISLLFWKKVVLSIVLLFQYRDGRSLDMDELILSPPLSW